MAKSECPLSPNGEHEMCDNSHSMVIHDTCGLCVFCLIHLLDDEDDDSE